MLRSDVINYIIDQMGYTSYLEIGTQVKARNFDKINIQSKECIDPDHKAEADFKMTSDAFFNQNSSKYDIIFIDGKHTYEQSTIDFNNALECLNEKGCIVLHDALPHNKEYTQPNWCGDVYKTCLDLSGIYDLRTFDGDHGVCVVFPDKQIGIPMNVSHEYSIDYLKKQLNAVESLKELIPVYKEEFSDVIEKAAESVITDQEKTLSILEDMGKNDNKELDGMWNSLSEENTQNTSLPNYDFSLMSDEEVKTLYKQVTGAKRVSSKITRDHMIAKIEEINA